MPSNYNFVCFECCLNVRRSKRTPHAPRCPQCSGECVSLGYKIPLPAKQDGKAWRALYVQLREGARQDIFSGREALVRRVHDLERQIAELERRPPNSGRDRTIKELKHQLSKWKNLNV